MGLTTFLAQLVSFFKSDVKEEKMFFNFSGTFFKMYIFEVVTFFLAYCYPINSFFQWQYVCIRFMFLMKDFSS